MESIWHSSRVARAERRAVVVTAAAVPFAVPGRAFQRLGFSLRCAFPGLRTLAPSPRALCRSARSRPASCSRNQPSQTLSPLPSSPTRFMPSFQSPPRISGRPCGAGALRWRDRARARNARRAWRASRSTSGVKKESCWPGSSCWPVDEGHLLVQDRCVAGHLDVMARWHGPARPRRPRSWCARRRRCAAATNAARRLPRTAGCAALRICVARQRRIVQQQRQRVLQLVAEAERAARLVEGRARADAAGQALVGQPVD